MKADKMIFGNLAGVKDYKNLEKLVKDFERASSDYKEVEDPRKKVKMEMLKIEIKELLPEVEEGLKRIIDIYSNAAKDMTEDNAVYTIQSVRSFLSELKEMQKNVSSYEGMVG